MTSYVQRQRQRTFDRMLKALRRGTHPRKIKGDRDVLQVAIEQYNKELQSE